MKRSVIDGYCNCCGSELMTVWDKGSSNCPPYIEYTNIADCYDSYCQDCVKRIEGHDVYKNLSDVAYFEARDEQVTLYCQKSGDILAEFTLD